MDAGIGTRPTTALTAAVLALLIGVLAALSHPLAAFAATSEESTAETDGAVLEQVDPLAAGLAITALLVALALVFLLARRLFKTS